MKWKNKIGVCLCFMLAMMFMFHTTALADDIGDTGGTGQGNITGTNVYTFNYIYDRNTDAIELQVVTKNTISRFGNTTMTTYTI